MDNLKDKKPVYKKWWFWVLLTFLIFLIVPVKQPATTEISAPEASSEASSEATPEAPEEPQTTEEKLTAIIDSLNFKYSDLKIYQNEGSVKISLHYDDDSWDETKFCSDCLTDYINLCAQAYQIEGIDNVQYFVFCKLIDSRGNEVSEKGFAMSMLKDKYEAYDWDNIEFVAGSYSQIEADSEYIDIHEGIKKNVDFNKMYYKG